MGISSTLASDSSAANSDTLGPQVVIISSVFASLATVAVAGRIWARKTKRVPLGADDWMAVVALIFNWAFFAITITGVSLGLGQHLTSITPSSNIGQLLKYLFTASLLYKLSAVSVKFSLLLLYKRVFVTPLFTRLIYAVAGLILAYGVIEFFLTLFECSPVSTAWTGQGGVCTNAKSYAVSYAVLNIIADVVVWVMPIPMVWGLHLPVGQRVGISAVFLLGAFDAGAAIARLVVTLMAAGNSDLSWTNAVAFEWATIELSVGIICGCLPVMRNVLVMLLPPFARHWMSAPRRSQSPITLPLRKTSDQMRVAALPMDSEEHLHNNSIALALMSDDKFDASGQRNGFQRQLSL